jgi:serine/threonine protein kinase
MSLAATLCVADIARILPCLTERYDFLGTGPIGRPSGFGAVWRAYDRLLCEIVAIKISDMDLRSEVRFCRSIDGHTVRVYDYFQQNGWYAYAMELLTEPWTTIDELISAHDGRDMLQRYFDGCQVIDAVLAALNQVHGLPYSREQRHVHADIQPRNLFVRWKPKSCARTVFRLRGGRELIKIIDLGLTVRKGDEHVGYHPAYSSPNREVAHHGDDLYSLAVVFLELVTGVRPSHFTMGHSARIRDHVIAHRSGSVAIDSIAIEFANCAARAAANPALTATSLREQLDLDLFQQPQLVLLALRELDRYRPGPLKKSEMAEMLFPMYAEYHGWKNTTNNRLLGIQEDIAEMAETGLLVRDGYRYHP